MHRILIASLLGALLAGCGVPRLGNDPIAAGFPEDMSEVEHLIPQLPLGYRFVMMEGRSPAGEIAQVIEVAVLPVGADPRHRVRLCVQAAGVDNECPQGINGQTIALPPTEARFSDPDVVTVVTGMCVEVECGNSDLALLREAWSQIGSSEFSVG